MGVIKASLRKRRGRRKEKERERCVGVAVDTMSESNRSGQANVTANEATNDLVKHAHYNEPHNKSILQMKNNKIFKTTEVGTNRTISHAYFRSQQYPHIPTQVPFRGVGRFFSRLFAHSSIHLCLVRESGRGCGIQFVNLLFLLYTICVCGFFFFFFLFPCFLVSPRSFVWTLLTIYHGSYF